MLVDGFPIFFKKGCQDCAQAITLRSKIFHKSVRFSRRLVGSAGFWFFQSSFGVGWWLAVLRVWFMSMSPRFFLS
jgi:hypothetical protein